MLIEFVDVNLFNWMEADKIINSNVNPYEIEPSFLTYVWKLLSPYWDIIIPTLTYLFINQVGKKSVGEILFGLSLLPINSNAKKAFSNTRRLLLVVMFGVFYSLISNLFAFAIWKAYTVIFILILFDFSTFFISRRCLHDYITGSLAICKK